MKIDYRIQPPKSITALQKEQPDSVAAIFFPIRTDNMQKVSLEGYKNMQKNFFAPVLMLLSAQPTNKRS